MSLPYPLESVDLDQGSFNDLVQSAWVQGVAEADADSAKASAGDDETRETACSSTARPCQTAPGCPEHAAAAALKGSEVPAGIVESVLALVGTCPQIVAGMPLPVFWSRVLALRSHSKEDPKQSVQRMLDFRRKYGWPLTISTSHVARALRSGMQRFLPARGPHERPIVTYVFRNVDTSACALEEYQMLSVFMLEAALRSAGSEGGLTIVADLRGITSALARAAVGTFSDVARSLAMVSGTLPVKISRVQLIEGEIRSRTIQAALSMFFAQLGHKIVSRCGRGDVAAAVDAIGAAELPRSLGGERDDEADWQEWLLSWHKQELLLGLRARGADDDALLGAATTKISI